MSDTSVAAAQPWYRSLTRSQWNVLIAANLGWLFDGYETFALIISVGVALRGLLEPSQYGQIPVYAGTVIALTLLGWGIGGMIGGVIADYLGRKRAMMIAILGYSLLTGLSAFAWDWTSFAVMRFLVGVAIGSEWVTGTSIVAELWPDKNRGKGVGLMQCGLGIGFFLASLAWLFISPLGPDAWRYMFLLGVLPGLLTLWVRKSIPESDKWERANDKRVAAVERQRSGAALSAQEQELTRFTVAGLFADAEIRKRVILAFFMSLATTFAFWGISAWIPPYIASVAGKAGLPPQQWASYAGLAYNGASVIGYAGFRLPGRCLWPQARYYRLRAARVPVGAGPVPVDARSGVDAGRRGLMRHVRIWPVHLDGGLAAGILSDADAGHGRGLRVQHATADRLGGPADLRLADRQRRRFQPGSDGDLVDLYPEPAGRAVSAGDQGQTAAGVTGRPLRVRWGRGLAAGRFSGT